MARKANTAAQLPLRFDRPSWGGRRARAGRKAGGRRTVAHRTRAAHRASLPVHVTLRARAGLPSFREQAIFRAVRAAIGASSCGAFRVVQFSVQRNHLHLVVEAHDRGALARGMHGLAIRVARANNRVLGVRGRVWRERYHAREVSSPRAVRALFVYVLMNAKKHGHTLRGADACSSAIWFDGFAHHSHPEPIDHASPVRTPRTWLARIGWRRHGLIAPTERPAKPLRISRTQ